MSTDANPTGPIDNAIVELRQYTLHPGRREDLIDLFEWAFVESQEETGMSVLGTFRQVEQPDRFVWLRGFPSMSARAESLARFYDGPVWREHRDAANATMIDSDDVLLLRRTDASSGLPYQPNARPPAGVSHTPSGRLVLTLYYLNGSDAESFHQFFNAQLRPVFEAAGARPIAWYETEDAENTFPRLPVREGERVFIWAAGFPTAEQQAQVLATLEDGAAWPGGLVQALSRRLRRAHETLVLEPTTRSQWQARPDSFQP